MAFGPRDWVLFCPGFGEGFGFDFSKAEVVPVGFTVTAVDGKPGEVEAEGSVGVFGGPFDAVGGAFAEESPGEGEIESGECGGQDGNGGGIDTDDFGAGWVGHELMVMMVELECPPAPGTGGPVQGNQCVRGPVGFRPKGFLRGGGLAC